jgi:hypothetical protein
MVLPKVISLLPLRERVTVRGVSYTLQPGAIHHLSYHLDQVHAARQLPAAPSPPPFSSHLKEEGLSFLCDIFQNGFHKTFDNIHLKLRFQSMGLVVGMINTKNLEIRGEIPLANPSLKSPQTPFNIDQNKSFIGPVIQN